jgi:starch phosphorylase
VTLIQRFGSALNLNVHYKRPELFFADVERLKSIAARQPFQALFTGKAHPQDQGGKEAIERLHQWMREVAG